MDSDADTWFLSRAERGNLATDVHSGRAGSPAWSEGNLVRPLIHGASYFARLHEELTALQAGDRVWFTDWRGDADERLLERPPSTGPAHPVPDAAATPGSYAPAPRTAPGRCTAATCSRTLRWLAYGAGKPDRATSRPQDVAPSRTRQGRRVRPGEQLRNSDLRPRQDLHYRRHLVHLRLRQLQPPVLDHRQRAHLRRIRHHCRYH